MILKYEQTLFCYNDEEETTEIFYEPSDEEERDAMEEILYETYFKAEGDTAEMKEMKKMGIRYMLLDDIIIYRPFEEDLRAYFMQDAYEALENGEVDAVYEP